MVKYFLIISRRF